MDYDKKQDVELGLRLREARESMHYTQSQFAEALGIEISQYKRIEKGISRITVDKIRILNDKYQINPNFLILGDQKNAEDMEQIFVNSESEAKNRHVQYILAYVSRTVFEKG